MPTTRRTPARRPLPIRHAGRRPHAPVAAPPAAAVATIDDATASAQRCGGDQDVALYRCDCGCDFPAAVSTTVDCPACGALQDW